MHCFVFTPLSSALATNSSFHFYLFSEDGNHHFLLIFPLGSWYFWQNLKVAQMCTNIWPSYTSNFSCALFSILVTIMTLHFSTFIFHICCIFLSFFSLLFVLLFFFSLWILHKENMSNSFPYLFSSSLFDNCLISPFVLYMERSGSAHQK